MDENQANNVTREREEGEQQKQNWQYRSTQQKDQKSNTCTETVI
jgi:hypothetical protein